MTTRRRLLSGLFLATGTVLGGCSLPGTPRPADPVPGTGTGSDCAAEGERSAGEPGAAEPLLVLGSLGYTPVILYRDGAVVVPAGEEDSSALGDLLIAPGAAGMRPGGPAPLMAPGYHGAQPGRFLGGSLNVCQLQAVTQRAEDLLIGPTDFGDPQVTDHTSTRVSFDGHEHSVYAFGLGDPQEWEGLSRAQQQARQDLADLWTTLVDEAELGRALPIERVHLYRYGPLADAEVSGWPLDEPPSSVLREDCTTLSDPEQVEAIVSRLAQEEDLVPEEPWRLAVVTAAPGSADCEF